jgi:MFS family permease
VTDELRFPREDPLEHTSRHGPLFWAGVAVGSVVMGVGLVALVSKAGATNPANFAVFFIGLALVHDFVLAPATIAAATGLRRLSPRAGRGLLVGALVVSAIVVLVSAPLLFGWGAQPDNPSFLPRNYAFGLAVVLAVVWGVAAVMLLGRTRWGSS